MSPDMGSATQKLIAVAGLVLVAAITPGPNNFIVMQAAVRAGLAGALPAITAIVLGSVVLLSVVATGIGATLHAFPGFAAAITVGGCIYLVWIGISLMFPRARDDTHRAQASGSLPTGALGVFAFQFVNPKGWVMMLTATSTGVTFAYLTLLFTVIPAGCLILWSALGAVLKTQLERPAFKVGFERTMGGLLVASALLLLI